MSRISTKVTPGSSLSFSASLTVTVSISAFASATSSLMPFLIFTAILLSFVDRFALFHEGAWAFPRVRRFHHRFGDFVLDSKPFFERPATGALDALLDRADRDRTVGRDCAGELFRFGEDLRRRHDVIHQPQPIGLLRVDPITREQDLHRLAVGHLT